MKTKRAAPKTQRIVKAHRDPKLCPVCWRAMEPVGADGWECAKHGKPDRP